MYKTFVEKQKQTMGNSKDLNQWKYVCTNTWEDSIY